MSFRLIGLPLAGGIATDELLQREVESPRLDDLTAVRALAFFVAVTMRLQASLTEGVAAGEQQEWGPLRCLHQLVADSAGMACYLRRQEPLHVPVGPGPLPLQGLLLLLDLCLELQPSTTAHSYSLSVQEVHDLVPSTAVQWRCCSCSGIRDEERTVLPLTGERAM